VSSNFLNKAETEVLDLYLVFQNGINFLKENNKRLNKPLDWLGVIEDVVADDFVKLISSIVYPNEEKELKKFINIIKKEKSILKKKIAEKNYDDISNALFYMEDHLSKELNRYGFIEYNDSEFADIINSISDEEWDRMGEE
jgi:hypothetical protein